jgi:hypothetical protein
MQVTYARRLWLVSLAGWMGWAAGFLASVPAMLVIGWRDSEHDPNIFAATIGSGLLVWACWTLVLGVAVWLLFAVPSALLLSPGFLIRHRLRVLLATALLTVLLLSLKLMPFQDYAASRTPLRFVLYMPYGAFALFFAVVTAWWYLRGLSRTN